jgi:lambda family phage holin
MKVLENFMDKLNDLPAPIYALFVGAGIALLRGIYDKEETSPMRILLESSICGCLSMTAGYGAMAMGMNINWVLFFAGTIGYLGSMNVRILVLKFLNKKVDE